MAVNAGSLRAALSSLVPRKQPNPPDVGAAPRQLRQAASGQNNSMGAALNASATALENVQNSLNGIHGVLRQSAPALQELLVVDDQGKVIAALGRFVFSGSGAPAVNYFSEIHVGDPLGTGDPSLALFSANPDGTVVIGQNGSLSIVDPFGLDAAWLGTEPDTNPVTNAVSNGSGGIRLTVVGHRLLNGDQVKVLLAPGSLVAEPGRISNGTGVWLVTVVDANTIDLQNSVYVGTYVTGGVVNRLLHIENIANNGSGLIRIQITAHKYETSDKVNLHGTGILGSADTQWLIKVIDADHFDLVGSTYVGGYSNGSCLRYFAGGLFEQIAVGPSFPDYKLRAFPDGTLKIKDADITITGTDGFGNTVVVEMGAGIGGIDIKSFTPLGVQLGESQLGANVIVLTDDSTGNQCDLSSNHVTMQGSLGVSIDLFGNDISPTMTVSLPGGTPDQRSFMTGAGVIDAGAFFANNGTPGTTETLHCLASSSGAPGAGSLSVTTAVAVTSVTGGGVSTTTGIFVTGVALTIADHSVNGGILTS